MGRHKAEKWCRGYKLMAPEGPGAEDGRTMLQSLTLVPSPEFDEDIVFRYLRSAMMCRDKRLGSSLYECTYVRAADQSRDEFMPKGTVRTKCLIKLKHLT